MACKLGDVACFDAALSAFGSGADKTLADKEAVGYYLSRSDMTDEGSRGAYEAIRRLLDKEDPLPACASTLASNRSRSRASPRGSRTSSRPRGSSWRTPDSASRRFFKSSQRLVCSKQFSS